eukprot:scaffold36634_cov21-Tisochrysis_lutea.AAC.1
MSGLWGTIQATCSQAGARILFTTPPVATKRGSPCAEPPLGVRQLFGAADAAASGCSEGGSVSGSAARCGSVPGSAARSGSAPGSAAAGTPPRQGLSAAAAVPLPSDDEKEGGGGEGVRWCGGLNGSCGDAGLHAGPKEQGPQQQHLGHQQQQQQQQQGSPFQGSGRLLSGKEIAAAYKQAQAVHMRIGHACNLWKPKKGASCAHEDQPCLQPVEGVHTLALFNALLKPVKGTSCAHEDQPCLQPVKSAHAPASLCRWHACSYRLKFVPALGCCVQRIWGVSGVGRNLRHRFTCCAPPATGSCCERCALQGWSDARGAGAPNAQELAYIYMMALDACKTGTLPSIGPHLRQPLDDQGRVHEPVWDRSKEAQRQAQR